MDKESGCRKASAREPQLKFYKTTLLLAYQSFGVVYGDLCTSPIYVYKSTFSRGLQLHEEDHEIFGVFSLVFWSLTIIPLCKYIIFMLEANDNGEGPTSMVIADGILTPTMSVLSAVHGIHIKAKDLHQNYTVVIACVILVGLFALQHYGTHRVGFLFAPILIAWLLCISGIGIYNIFHWNPCVVQALSPHYIYNFFQKTGKTGWSSLGGIVLCVTGAEAMFADLGHFSQLSLRIAFTGLVYPCLVLAYMGEAAYLSKNKSDVQRSFYKAIPDAIFWPIFIISTLATVVSSQAIISATFSIISQCRALSCFPRVRMVHTSNNIHGQIYIPEVNWILMVLCLAFVVVFQDTKTIGNAYGLAVITVMFVTTLLMFLIIITVWKQNVFLAFLFIGIFGFMELSYFIACLSKVHKGGWLPLVVSVVIVCLMLIWHYGSLEKQAFELENKVSLDSLLSVGVGRVPGICLIYSRIPSGVPPMFAHFVTNFPASHQILVFVTIQSLVVPKVPVAERFLISRIGPSEFPLFRCIVRYGFKDVRDSYEFENQLIENISGFLKSELNSEQMAEVEQSLVGARNAVMIAKGSGMAWTSKKVRFQCLKAREQTNELMEAKEAGVTYMIGNAHVKANEASSIPKKFVINSVYGFLRRNSRRTATSLGIPHTALIEVGMVYRV